jgi:hypothetical protein
LSYFEQPQEYDMAEKLDLQDIQNLINVNPKLRKEMAKAAKEEADYWNSVVAACGGEASESRSASSDGKTHRQAILDALGTFKDGAKASDVRKKMEKDGHPISSTTFASTMAYLTSAEGTNEVTKRKAKKGGRDNLYKVKASAK